MLTFLAATVGGCSEARELSTSGQASSFVVGVAGGESPEGWKLTSKPTTRAVQAWANRDIIGDIGRRLRSEGSSWACEFAHTSIGLGSIGYFDENDGPIVTRDAASLGINSGLISALLHDLVLLHFRELVLVSTSICGPYKSP